ncbi:MULTISPECIES: EcsC family protein [unclassified Anaeromyxobacter]|uniref:EcsC family protein n=1 Tax=unclassified Anaeromyxobacter TaxID=2620896 RepID=UPI001F58DF72|nr:MULTISPECIES: EcsC family protein [unclassified Anaeromyxobacter]
MPGPLDRADALALEQAKHVLETPDLAIQLASRVGRPIERLVEKLPVRTRDLVGSATRTALEKGLELAVRTLDFREATGAAGAPPLAVRGAPGAASDLAHRAAVIASGALGGALGAATLAIELPFSTTLMLRSIADHARAQGEDLSELRVRLECLGVFAMGGRAASDDAAEAGYFAVRVALSQAVARAAEQLGARAMGDLAAERSAPAVARLVGLIAQRFGTQVAQKTVAQLVPIVGALAGAGINSVFIQHYQKTAWGHFTVRRLERSYGADEVRRAYEAIPG